MAPVQRLRAQLQASDIDGLKLDWVFEDMLRRGVSAWALAQYAGALALSEAFHLGLVQDMGLMYLAAKHPEKAHFIEGMANLPASRRLTLEEQHLGENHAQVYAEAAAELGLPEAWTEVVRAHHQPMAALSSREAQRLLDLSRTADSLADLTQAEATTGTLETLKRNLQRLPSRQLLDPRVLFDEVRAAMPVFAKELDWPIEAQPQWGELIREKGPSALFVSSSYESLTHDLLELEQRRLGVRTELRAQVLAAPPERDEETGVLNYRGLTRHLRGALDALVLDQSPFALLWMSGPPSSAYEEINRLLRSSDAMCWHEGSWLIYLSDTGESGCKIVCDRIRAEVADLEALGWSVQAGQGLLPGVNGIVQQARDAALRVH